MITKLSIPKDFFKNADLAAVRKFLLHTGFRLTGKSNRIAEAYSLKKNQLIILPLRRSSPEYAKMLISLIEYAADALDLSFDDVLGLIANPDSDIMRYRIESEDSKFGLIRADEIGTATSGLYNVLLGSAHRIAKIKNRVQIRDSAKAYALNCKFGQTEYGSFVLKVFCPTNDFGIKTEDSEPYAREVTRAVVENFHFLAHGGIDDPSTPLPQTMSKDVAKAIMEMHPSSPLMFSASLKVRYSHLQDPSLPEKPNLIKPEIQELPFKSTLFDRAEILYNRFKKIEKEMQPEHLTGFITDLHMDPPSEQKKKDPLTRDILHQITIDVKYGARRRKVTARLFATDYHKAVHWHDQQLEIVMDAKIDKRSKNWAVQDLISLSPREKHPESKLF